MKFIFPQNYNFNSKIFGFIDYSTAFLNIIFAIILCFFLHIFIKNLSIKIFIFITFYFPLFLFSLLGLNGEKITYFFVYIFKYFFKPKLYLYKKFF